jgi:hypothetical protein
MLPRNPRAWRLFRQTSLVAILLPVSIQIAALARGHYAFAAIMTISTLIFIGNYLTVRSVSMAVDRGDAHHES